MDYKELGLKIASLRKEKQLSQTILAKQLGISRATISSFENGRGGDIGLKKILLIVDYLGYTLSLEKTSPFPNFEQLRHEHKYD